jgi:hypothetical protein
VALARRSSSFEDRSAVRGGVTASATRHFAVEGDSRLE